MSPTTRKSCPIHHDSGYCDGPESVPSVHHVAALAALYVRDNQFTSQQAVDDVMGYQVWDDLCGYCVPEGYEDSVRHVMLEMLALKPAIGPFTGNPAHAASEAFLTCCNYGELCTIADESHGYAQAIVTKHAEALVEELQLLVANVLSSLINAGSERDVVMEDEPLRAALTTLVNDWSFDGAS